MKTPKRKSKALTTRTDVVSDVYQSIAAILETARASAYRAVNEVMVQAYWEIGRVIVEEEQRGKKRASYGKTLIAELAQRLTADFGKGFTKTNLFYMRQFYVTFPNFLDAARGESSIRHSLRDESSIFHAARGESSRPQSFNQRQGNAVSNSAGFTD